MRNPSFESRASRALILAGWILAWNVPGLLAADGVPGSPRGTPRLVPQIGGSGAWSLAYAPDGRHALTAGAEGVARLWDLETGALIRVLEREDSGITSVAIAPDGRRALIGSRDKTARLWNLETGALIHSLEGHSGPVSAVAIAPDGRHALTGSLDTTARLWNLATGKPIRSLIGHTGGVTSAVIAPDGRHALTGSLDTTARWWGLRTGVTIRSLDGHGDRVASVAIAPDGRRALTGGADRTARLWDLETGTLIRSLQGHSGPVLTVAIASGGRRALTGSHDATARLWDLETGTLIRTLKPGYRVHAVAIAPDGRRALTGGLGATARLWDLETGTPIRPLEGHGTTVDAVAIAPGGRYLLTGGTGKHARLWDLWTGKTLGSFCGHAAGVTSVAIGRRGLHALTGSRDKTARVWSLRTRQALRSLIGHTGEVTSVATAPQGRLALTGSLDTTARLWDLQTGKTIRSLIGHAAGVTSVAIAPDGRHALTGSLDTTARLWDLETGKLIRTLTGHRGQVFTVAIAPDGRHALTGGFDTTARLWDLETGKLIHSLNGHGAAVRGVAIAPDGRRALTACFDDQARLWDLETGKLLVTLDHGHRVGAVAFTHDGRRALTGSRDGTTALWDLEAGRELCRLLSFDDGTWAVVDPEGRYDAAHGGDVPDLHWVVGDEPIELVQLKERYYDPGLLAKHLGLSKEPLRSVEALAGVRLFPSMTVTAPRAGDPKGTLGITLTGRGGGIGRVVVKVNGKEIVADARGSSPDTDPRPNVARLAVPLAGDPRLRPGAVNRVEVQVYNADGSLCSRGAVVEYEAGGVADAGPDLWAIVVGTADYAGQAIDLHYAAKDAEAFARALRVAAAGLLGADHVHITTLSTERAQTAARPTKANIVEALRALARSARSTDILVIYLSGHGVVPASKPDYHYLTAEASSFELADEQVRRRDALSAAELAELIRAIPAVDRQVLVLDTCAAGRALETLGQSRGVSGDQVRALERIKDRNGLHLLAGAAADAPSYEASRYGQGLLTYSLLLGLTGPGLKGTEVDVLTWFGYAVDEVPELAQGIGGIQKPLLCSPRAGASFPVGLLQPADRRQIPLPKARPLVLRAAFQEETSFDDLLGLGGRVDELLREASTRGEDTGPILVEEAEDAYRLVGRYRIHADSVLVEVKIHRGTETVSQVSVRGRKQDTHGLARKIVAELDKLLRP
ncbi:MAG TPA: caspase family protein [Isosphaeraceae bacterium]|nr:caspase family protein [Isosphaeraceae bacterium]